MKTISILYLIIVAAFSSTPQLNTINTLKSEQEITFPSSDPEITLGGTITIPDMPITGAAVILSVAGPTDRDGTLGPHRYYKSMADSLAERGIATLRYDSRGVGQSEGNLLDTDLSKRAGDACKAVEALKKHFGKNTIKTGFIGMSEGGGIAMLAAQKCTTVNFNILLSAPIRKGKEALSDQMFRMIEGAALPEESKSGLKKELLNFIEILSGENPAAKRNQIEAVLSGLYGSIILPAYQFVPQTLEGRVDFVLSPWYQSQLHYDITEAVQESNYPILAIYGDLDFVIVPKLNAILLNELRPDAEVEIKKGLNHLLQKAKTGAPTEYALLPDAVAKNVTDQVATWVHTINLD